MEIAQPPLPSSSSSTAGAELQLSGETPTPQTPNALALRSCAVAHAVDPDTLAADLVGLAAPTPSPWRRPDALALAPPRRPRPGAAPTPLPACPVGGLARHPLRRCRHAAASGVLPSGDGGSAWTAGAAAPASPPCRRRTGATFPPALSSPTPASSPAPVPKLLSSGPLSSLSHWIFASLDEISVCTIPAALYLVKNLLQYYIFAYVDAPSYQILKNFNIISTGVLYRIILKRKLSEIQWAAFILLCAGCTTAQLNSSSDRVLQTPLQGWMMAIVMALLSGFAGVYTEAIMKKRPSRNINVQNFWLYVFGMIFNVIAIFIQDFDAVMNKGFFHGYSLITTLMILNHALSGIAVSFVMKYADNIVKVYSTSVAMLLTAVASVFLFGFHLSLAFFLGSTVVSVAVYLHSIGKPRR